MVRRSALHDSEYKREADWSGICLLLDSESPEEGGRRILCVPEAGSPSRFRAGATECLGSSFARPGRPRGPGKLLGAREISGNVFERVMTRYPRMRSARPIYSSAGAIGVCAWLFGQKLGRTFSAACRLCSCSVFFCHSRSLLRILGRIHFRGHRCGRPVAGFEFQWGSAFCVGGIMGLTRFQGWLGDLISIGLSWFLVLFFVYYEKIHLLLFKKGISLWLFIYN